MKKTVMDVETHT